MRIPPFSTPGRFWRGNLHTHSTLSDGALNPADVVEAYKRAGYDFLQLSDHFLGRFDWPIADTRKLRSNQFTTLIGAEVHAMGTTVGEYWHIVATGLPLIFRPPNRMKAGRDSRSGRGRRAPSSASLIPLGRNSRSRMGAPSPPRTRSRSTITAAQS